MTEPAHKPRILYLHSETSIVDQGICAELERWLYTLGRDPSLTTQWHRIPAGAEVQAFEQSALNDAEVILVLLSSDFLSCDHCYQLALAALGQRARGAVVVPILLRPVPDLRTLAPSFAEVQALPRNGVPLSRWEDRDNALQHITRELSDIINVVSTTKAAHARRASSVIDPSGTSTRLRPGDLIGKFRLVREIGTGAFGRVFEAVHDYFPKRVALKVVPPWRDPISGFAMLQWDAMAATVAAHPGVAEIYDVGELPDGGAYMAMELLLGKPLSSFGEPTESVRQRATFAMVAVAQLATTMAEAHLRGVVHCDLKPRNIVVTNDPLGVAPFRTKIFDFGLARCTFPTAIPDPFAHDDHVYGTPAYMPPERWTNKLITPAADVYSLALILLELIAARPIFRGDQLAIVRSQQSFDISEFTREWPTAFRDLVRDALSVAPDKRPAMSEIAGFLHGFDPTAKNSGGGT